LAGYCVGGVVAFEMTRQLKEKGKEVSATFLLDSYVDSSYYFKTHKQKKIVRHYNKTKKRLTYLIEMFTSWKAFKMRINAKKDYLAQKHFEQNNTMSEEDTLALEQFTKAAGMMHGILDQYHLKPQNINVDLFRSKDHPEYGLAPSHLGWKKAALKGVKIHNIPGDNFDLTKSPFDKVLARMFQKILNKKHVNLVAVVSFIQEIINFQPFLSI
jgi:thioesterase domain-containing protein